MTRRAAAQVTLMPRPTRVPAHAPHRCVCARRERAVSFLLIPREPFVPRVHGRANKFSCAFEGPARTHAWWKRGYRAGVGSYGRQ
ncbi:hypothetical protein HYPSUDRAFT_39868 [Hypholoma sublateritium FD-334 SS-4]|uniref:Uncharacterized protein n=1 Tax=Hypholoma sublateritium (strain FD-334 SS-4) TaxID=945553 RepID=A0A0D2L857_HYPSF|nr:hypothetical protein HYPSUDRAFT_39868 [Hypholoma sublateritium FD-334 SS-4]